MIIYIYMFLLLDGDNDKLPIVGMARGSFFSFRRKDVMITKSSSYQKRPGRDGSQPLIALGEPWVNVGWLNG